MLDIKQNKLLVFLVLLVVVTVLNLFIGKQTTLQYKMQDALESHDHESALIFASSLLEKEPGNQKAINVVKESGQILLYLQLAQSKIPEFKVIKDQDTGQLFFYKHTTKSSADELVNTADNVMVTPEKVYEEFNSARAYAAKAKDLDSKFETTLNFERRLDSAQTYVLNILAENVFDAGKSVYSIVFKEYEEKSAIINSASSSKYLNVFLKVQSAWAPMETPADEIKHNIDPLLDKMDDAGQMVAEFKTGKLTDSLLSYIQVVRKSVNTFLTPKGSYKDFIKVASSSTDEYKQARRKLKRVLPGSANANNFSSLVKEVADYKLFRHDSTADLIKQNQYLQGA